MGALKNGTRMQPDTLAKLRDIEGLPEHLREGVQRYIDNPDDLAMLHEQKAVMVAAWDHHVREMHGALGTDHLQQLAAIIDTVAGIIHKTETARAAREGTMTRVEARAFVTLWMSTCREWIEQALPPEAQADAWDGLVARLRPIVAEFDLGGGEVATDEGEDA